jgi:hypothetical protein
MHKFIHRKNLALFKVHLDDLGLTDAQRKAILRLLTEEHARGHTTPRRSITSGDLANTFRGRAARARVENVHSHEAMERTVDPYQSTRTAPRRLSFRSGNTPMSTWGLK